MIPWKEYETTFQHKPEAIVNKLSRKFSRNGKRKIKMWKQEHISANKYGQYVFGVVNTSINVIFVIRIMHILRVMLPPNFVPIL